MIRQPHEEATMQSPTSLSVLKKRTKTIKVKSPAEERLPVAHLPVELVVARGGWGGVKSPAHHRCWARAA